MSIDAMAKQTKTYELDGLGVELQTDGPESQDGHEIGSDVLHMELTRAIEGVLKSHD